MNGLVIGAIRPVIDLPHSIERSSAPCVGLLSHGFLISRADRSSRQSLLAGIIGPARLDEDLGVRVNLIIAAHEGRLALQRQDQKVGLIEVVRIEVREEILVRRRSVGTQRIVAEVGHVFRGVEHAPAEQGPVTVEENPASA